MSKQLVYFFIAFVSVLSATFVLFVTSSSIPTSAIRENVGVSLQTFQLEGLYPTYGLPFRKIVLDNFTDSLMFNTAYTVDSSRPIESSLLNNRILLTAEEIDQIKNLESAHTGTSTITSNYQRYWHGYLTFLRPLLTVLSYDGIRIILALLLYIPFFFLLYLLYRNNMILRGAALIVGALYVDFLYIHQSIQFSQVFILGISAAICLTLLNQKERWYPVIFFITGMLTAFFDLLTAPLVTLGFLLIVASKPNRIYQFITNTLAWTSGYGLFWITKWIITEVFYGKGSILNAFEHVINRTITEPDPEFSYIKTITLNINQLIGYDKTNKVAALVLFILAMTFLFFFYKKHLTKKEIYTASFWLLIAVIPYAWYLVAANHSYLHVWYTYRTQVITVASLFLMYCSLIDWKRVGLLLRKIRPKSNKKR